MSQSNHSSRTEDAQRLSLMASVCDTLKTQARVETLLLLSDGWGLSTIAGELDLAYATVHGYVQAFEDAGLVEQDPDGNRRLTGFGEQTLGTLARWDEELGELAKDQLRGDLAEFTDRAHAVGLSKKELRTLLEEAYEEEIRSGV